MKKNKQKRLSLLRRILQEEKAPNQDTFKQLLLNEGIAVSQATLSRDLKELGGYRRAVDGERFTYALPRPEDSIRALEALGRAMREYVTEMIIVGNFLVIRTTPGNASSLCISLDNVAWKEIAGTVAGDDTILVIARTDEDMKKAAERLEQLRM